MNTELSIGLHMPCTNTLIYYENQFKKYVNSVKFVGQNIFSSTES